MDSAARVYFYFVTICLTLCVVLKSNTCSIVIIHTTLGHLHHDKVIYERPSSLVLEIIISHIYSLFEKIG